MSTRRVFTLPMQLGRVASAQNAVSPSSAYSVATLNPERNSARLLLSATTVATQEKPQMWSAALGFFLFT